MRLPLLRFWSITDAEAEYVAMQTAASSGTVRPTVTLAMQSKIENRVLPQESTLRNVGQSLTFPSKGPNSQ
ncbi:MAG: hypothetical protein AAFY20_23820 [Cyanobacteria bacterium J06639_14]